MSVSVGTKLGPYEIQSPLGAGGMGEVYKACDTRLERTVAIKVLPSHLSSDPGLKQRFEREAKAISSLQHPHICALYDVGLQDEIDFLVMEYLEGETLAERLAKGPLKVDQALKIGVEIAEALDGAHKQGILHRDLKPGNIMLTKVGAKLMDFGLAKPGTAVAVAGAIGPITPSTPTMSLASLTSATASPLTQKGSIVGTFQYLAPEVLQGTEADERSDLFSFGCVLYEMITGRQAFAGKSQLSVLTAILEKEPEPISTVQPTSPPALDHVIGACLAKDPDQRYQTARDVALELKWIAESGSQGGVDTRESGRFDRYARLPWAVAGILICIAAFAGWWAGTRNQGSPPQESSVFSFIPPPANATFHDFGFSGGPAVISPDGDRLAFSATDDDGVTRLYVRPLASTEARAVTGTEGASMPFWSPDSGSLGFVADEKLKTVNLANGTVEVLGETTEDTCANRGAWSPDGTILYTPQGCTGPVNRISASGGKATPVTKLSNGDAGDTSPSFLPDNRHFLYCSSADSGSIWMGSLDLSEQRLILKNAGSPEFVDGHLLFTRDNRVFAQPFDPTTGKLDQEAIPLAQALSYSASSEALVFQGGTQEGRLQWFDKNGNSLSSVGPTAVYNSVRISPDGKRILAEIQDQLSNSSDLWSYSAAGGPGTRLTFGPGVKDFGAWSSDGTYIAYTCLPDGKPAICRKPANGSGTEVKLFTFGSDITSSGITSPVVVDWSPDGRYISLNQHVTKASLTELSVLPLFGDRKPFEPAPVNAIQFDGRFSPDGHWLAYFSYETGRPEVYVIPFPGPGGKFQISQNGGWNTHWDKKGHLYYMTMGNRLMEAELGFSGGAVQVKALHPLFQINLPSFADPFYDVSPDGTQFLVVSSADPNASRFIGLLLNWNVKLKERK